MTIIERFWSKVDKECSEFFDCWEWIGTILPSGYGQFRIDGHGVRAHRFMWELVNGTIPKDLYVLHECDNRSCVNPDHLRLGTHKENMEDMTEKGRGKVGEKNGRSKLTVEDIISIRFLYTAGFNMSYLANRFGVSKVQISSIIRREAWRHID